MSNLDLFPQENSEWSTISHELFSEIYKLANAHVGIAYTDSYIIRSVEVAKYKTSLKILSDYREGNTDSEEFATFIGLGNFESFYSDEVKQTLDKIQSLNDGSFYGWMKVNKLSITTSQTNLELVAKSALNLIRHKLSGKKIIFKDVSQNYHLDDDNSENYPPILTTNQIAVMFHVIDI